MVPGYPWQTYCAHYGLALLIIPSFVVCWSLVARTDVWSLIDEKLVDMFIVLNALIPKKSWNKTYPFPLPSGSSLAIFIKRVGHISGGTRHLFRKVKGRKKMT